MEPEALLEKIDATTPEEMEKVMDELKAEHQKALEFRRDVERVIMDFPLPGDRVMNFMITKVTDINADNLSVTITPADGMGFADTTMRADDLRNWVERRWKELDKLAESIDD